MQFQTIFFQKKKKKYIYIYLYILISENIILGMFSDSIFIYLFKKIYRLHFK